jgi:hypothetical protein
MSRTRRAKERHQADFDLLQVSCCIVGQQVASRAARIEQLVKELVEELVKELPEELLEELLEELEQHHAAFDLHTRRAAVTSRRWRVAAPAVALRG